MNNITIITAIFFAGFAAWSMYGFYAALKAADVFSGKHLSMRKTLLVFLAFLSVFAALTAAELIPVILKYS